MSLSNESNDEDHIPEIIERNILLVLFDKILKAIPCSKVIIDDRLAAQTAVQQLIEMDFQKIAHIREALN